MCEKMMPKIGDKITSRKAYMCVSLSVYDVCVSRFKCVSMYVLVCDVFDLCVAVLILASKTDLAVKKYQLQ